MPAISGQNYLHFLLMNWLIITSREQRHQKICIFDYLTFKFIVEPILSGSTCAVDLIQRQRGAFPDEMHVAAVESWHEGRAFNTVLIS